MSTGGNLPEDDPHVEREKPRQPRSEETQEGKAEGARHRELRRRQIRHRDRRQEDQVTDGAGAQRPRPRHPDLPEVNAGPAPLRQSSPVKTDGDAATCPCPVVSPPSPPPSCSPPAPAPAATLSPALPARPATPS